MKNLFWMDVPSEGQLPWAEERVARCESMVMALAVQTFQQGLNVILDLGFSTLEQRKKFYDWCREKSLPFELHYLDVPVQERWRRVKERNRQLDAHSIPVDRATFDWMENYFQVPQDSELQEHFGKRIT
jgi:predicted kinase